MDLNLFNGGHWGDIYNVEQEENKKSDEDLINEFKKPDAICSHPHILQEHGIMPMAWTQLCSAW